MSEYVLCPRCGGDGTIDGYEPCVLCDGTGLVPEDEDEERQQWQLDDAKVRHPSGWLHGRHWSPPSPHSPRSH